MISSTLLRRKIATGDILLTNKLLGRNYSISGVVVKGSKRGRRLGFPTANIKTSQRALPPDGVYPALIGIKRKIFRGVLNVGRRPTFHRKSSNPLIEAHIFNFNRTLYGQEIEVIPLRRIRRERKFKDASSLITQIKKDIVISKAILASYEF